MLTVKQLLTACGLQTSHDRIKLVRHSDHLGRSIRRIIADGLFDIYQAEQSLSNKPFHHCEVILSFIATEGNQAEFYGAYRVHGSRAFRRKDFAGMPAYLSQALQDGRERIWYELEELPQFIGLRGRLIAQWVSTRGWYQTKDLAVYELSPPGDVMRFPGYQDVLLTWDELRNVTATPRAHREWRTALSSTVGIYRIVDLKSGKLYIGSAYGAEGIWGRWCSYAQTGHGGNKLLRDLEPEYFQWSIIRTLSGSMSAKEIIQVEKNEMRKHGSKAIGLNLS